MSRNWEFEASKLWPLLVDAARKEETLTYEYLASVVQTNALSMRYALDPIYKYCEEANIAPLSAIVVGKQNGRPGDGFIRGWGENYLAAFDEVYSFDWGKLANPFAGYGEEDTTESIAFTLLNNPMEGETVYAKIKVRGQLQQIFRAALLKAYEGHCAVCGCTLPSLLQAAHILPWSKANAQQRIDPRNGLLLCANHHKLFDAGQLTISKCYEILYVDPARKSGSYSDADVGLTIARHGQSLRLPRAENLRPLSEYIDDHHNTHEWKF